MNKQFGRIMEQTKDWKGIHRSHHYKIVFPTGLAEKLIKEAHGSAHNSRGKTATNLEEWWHPF